MLRQLLIVLLLICLQTNAQVSFNQIRLASAIEKAAQTGKPIFAQFVSATCQQCNEVAAVALKSPQLGKTINKKFIAIEIGLDHKDRQVFIDTYNPKQQIGTFFILGNGELVHVYPRTTTAYIAYQAEADKALNKIVEGKATLAELNTAVSNDPDNVPALIKNLETRLSVGLPTDSLLEALAVLMSAEMLADKKILTSIATMAPTLFSKANKLMRQNNDLFKQVWYTLPLQQRIAINQRIIKKSMDIAIAEKDKNRASHVAAFTADTYDYAQQKQKEYQKQLLSYFIGVKDTAAYIRDAIKYYDAFYMIVPVAEIKKSDSMARDKARDAAAEMVETDPTNPKIIYKKKTFTFAPYAQQFANSLNEGAWLLYTSSIDTNHLAKALGWAERAMEFYGLSPELIDTYARLLYVTGNPKKAMMTQQKAIDILLDRKFDTQRFDAVLQAMKNGEKLPV